MELERFATRYVEQSASRTRQAWLTGRRRVRLNNCSLNSGKSCLTMLDTFRASGGAILFHSGPVTPEYMQASANGSLDEYLASLAPERDREGGDEQTEASTDESETIEDRLTRLLRQRNHDFQKQMTATLQTWRQVT